jgi:hypothetical protein
MMIDDILFHDILEAALFLTAYAHLHKFVSDDLDLNKKK